jgi:hypothetical protein
MVFAFFLRLVLFVLGQVRTAEKKVPAKGMGSIKKDAVQSAVAAHLKMEQASIGFDPSVITKLMPLISQFVDLVITILNALGIFKTSPPA